MILHHFENLKLRTLKYKWKKSVDCSFWDNWMTLFCFLVQYLKLQCCEPILCCSFFYFPKWNKKGNCPSGNSSMQIQIFPWINCSLPSLISSLLHNTQNSKSRAVRSGEWWGYEICSRSDTHCRKHRLGQTVTYHKQWQQINVYMKLQYA